MGSVEYDEKARALYVRVKPGKVASTEAVSDSLFLDLDGHGEVLGLEILLPEDVRIERLRPLKIS
ncbi:MAG: DUF2283 domain-containing protein [Thermoplasmata archaeon]